MIPADRIQTVLRCYDINTPSRVLILDPQNDAYTFYKKRHFFVDDAPSVEEAIRRIRRFYYMSYGKEMKMSEITKKRITRILTNQKFTEEEKKCETPFNRAMLEEGSRSIERSNLRHYINRDVLIGELEALISRAEGGERVFLFTHSYFRLAVKAPTRTVAVAKLLLSKSLKKGLNLLDSFLMDSLNVLINHAPTLEKMFESSFEEQIEILSDLYFDDTMLEELSLLTC